MFRFAAASSKPSTLAQTVIRLGAVAAACSALTLSLPGCGGGSRAKDYVPDSVVSFGDENSAMEDYTGLVDPVSSGARPVQGLTYTVNYVVNNLSLGWSFATYCTDQAQSTLCGAPLAYTTSIAFTKDTNTATQAYYFDSVNAAAHNGSNIVTYIDLGLGSVDGATPSVAMKRTYNVTYGCSAGRLWNQIVAHSFNKGFESQCALDINGAKTYAQYGAKIADVQTQVANHRAELHEGVLVTLMVGQNDIIELYLDTLQHPQNEAANRQALSNRVIALGNVIKDILSTGAKVALAYPPDLSKSPLASQNNANPTLLALLMDDRYLGGGSVKIGYIPTLLRALGNEVLTDGRHFTVVETNNITSLTSTSYVYAPSRLCDASSTYVKPDGVTTEADPYKQVMYCNSSNFVTNGSASTYMWADDIHFAPAGHSLIGQQAASRVYNQF